MVEFNIGLLHSQFKVNQNKTCPSFFANYNAVHCMYHMLINQASDVTVLFIIIISGPNFAEGMIQLTWQHVHHVQFTLFTYSLWVHQCGASAKELTSSEVQNTAVAKDDQSPGCRYCAST